jgi:hypothetical protein
VRSEATGLASSIRTRFYNPDLQSASCRLQLTRRIEIPCVFLSFAAPLYNPQLNLSFLNLNAAVNAASSSRGPFKERQTSRGLAVAIPTGFRFAIKTLPPIRRQAPRTVQHPCCTWPRPSRRPGGRSPRRDPVLRPRLLRIDQRPTPGPPGLANPTGSGYSPNPVGPVAAPTGPRASRTGPQLSSTDRPLYASTRKPTPLNSPLTAHDEVRTVWSVHA